MLESGFKSRPGRDFSGFGLWPFLEARHRGLSPSSLAFFPPSPVNSGNRVLPMKELADAQASTTLWKVSNRDVGDGWAVTS